MEGPPLKRLLLAQQQRPLPQTQACLQQGKLLQPAKQLQQPRHLQV
jgi:hypothetical protein